MDREIHLTIIVLKTRLHQTLLNHRSNAWVVRLRQNTRFVSFPVWPISRLGSWVRRTDDRLRSVLATQPKKVERPFGLRGMVRYCSDSKKAQVKEIVVRYLRQLKEKGVLETIALRKVATNGASHDEIFVTLGEKSRQWQALQERGGQKRNRSDVRCEDMKRRKGPVICWHVRHVSNGVPKFDRGGPVLLSQPAPFPTFRSTQRERLSSTNACTWILVCIHTNAMMQYTSLGQPPYARVHTL